jgi:hypothetical protein
VVLTCETSLAFVCPLVLCQTFFASFPIPKRPILNLTGLSEHNYNSLSRYAHDFKDFPLLKIRYHELKSDWNKACLGTVREEKIGKLCKMVIDLSKKLPVTVKFK